MGRGSRSTARTRTYQEHYVNCDVREGWATNDANDSPAGGGKRRDVLKGRDADGGVPPLSPAFGIGDISPGPGEARVSRILRVRRAPALRLAAGDYPRMDTEGHEQRRFQTRPPRRQEGAGRGDAAAWVGLGGQR